MNTETQQPMFYFGRAPLPGSLITWAARAIFNTRSKDWPLDILPDRQQVTRSPDCPVSTEQFLGVLNADVLPLMQRMAAHFRDDSADEFVAHFPWPRSPDVVMVAHGSPNASFGYFYVGVSLVPIQQAPAKVRPDLEAEKRRADEVKRQAEFDARQAEYRRVDRERSKQIREAAAKRVCAFTAKANGNWPKTGTLLEVGDSLTIHANQAQRHAIVVAVCPGTALVEYVMPNGRTFRWEVYRIIHSKVRNISKVPARFAAP